MPNETASPTTAALMGANKRLSVATGLIIRAVLTIEIAEHVKGALKDEITRRANKTIDYIMDDFCGEGAYTKVPPSSLPGPPKAALDLAVMISAFASTSTYSTHLRNQLMAVAAGLTEKAYDSGGLA